MPFHNLLVLSLLASALSAQSWDTLQALQPGDRIQVVDTDGKQQRGTLTAVSADAITLETRHGQLVVDRSHVRRVQVRSNTARLRKTLIGIGVGVAIGATIDQTLGLRFRNEGTEDEGYRAITYIAPIALIGGLCAFPSYRTVYRAP